MAISKIKSTSIEDDAITSDKVADGVISAADVADGTLTSAKLSYPLTTFSSTGIDDNATSTAATIDSSGNVLVGKISTDFGTEGVTLFNSNDSGGTRTHVTADNQTATHFNRLNTDGDISRFYKDGTIVGSIGVTSLRMFVGTGDTGLFFNDQTDQIQPWNTSTNSARDAAIDLGTTDRRFKDLYLSGGAYLGGTGTANKLDDYEEGLHEATLTPSASGSVALGGTENTLSYVKIGNLVNVQGALGVNIPSSPVGYIKISMPFTAESLLENADKSACSLMFNNVNSANVADFVGIVQSGTSELRIYLGDTTYAEEDSAQQLRSGTSIHLNVSYRTT